MSGKGKLRALDPWFDSKEAILGLYSAGPPKEVADRWANIVREHVAPPYVFAVNGVWGGGARRHFCDSSARHSPPRGMRHYGSIPGSMNYRATLSSHC